MSPFGQNEWLVEEMYRKFRDDPSSVDPSWHEFLVDYNPEPTAEAAAGAPTASPDGHAAAPAPEAKPAAPETKPEIDRPQPAPTGDNGAIRSAMRARRGGAIVSSRTR